MVKIEKRFVFLCLGLLFVSQFNSIDAKSCRYGFYPEGDTCLECGTTYFSPNIRIVGGVPAVPHSWPAQVLIQQSIRGDYQFDGFNQTIDFNTYCGGTLINRYTVLTAAHCINKFFKYSINGTDYRLPVTFDYNPTFESMFTVFFGATVLNVLETSRTKMTVQKLIKHESYCGEDFVNDIALVILSEPVELNENVQVACLPPKSKFPPDNTPAVAVGWGATYEGGGLNSILKNVDLTIYDEEKCSFYHQMIDADFNRQICAGDLDGGKGTCQGDSGGGIYIFDQHRNKSIVVGATSAAVGCARPGYPALFTRISYYYDWIVSNWKIPESSTTRRTTKKKTTTKKRNTTTKKKKTTSKPRHKHHPH